MRVIQLLIITTLSLAVNVCSEEADSLLNNNTAFYEGKKLNFIIQPPDDFEMVLDEAFDDGFSFAFIPKKENYDSASMIIGINIFKVEDKTRDKFSIDQLITDDTTAIRRHYGEELTINETDPINNASGYSLRTFYLNDTTTFIPDVMLSYFDGDSEILIFVLSISDSFPRFLAEKIYIECLEKFKVLVKGKLGAE